MLSHSLPLLSRPRAICASTITARSSVQYEATGESEYQAVLLTAPGSPLAFLRAQGQLIPESILDCALSLRE